MTISTGGTLPTMTLKTVTADGPAEIDSGQIFKGRKVVLFGVPGAFTPTCTLNHLPGYIENAEALKAKGVDDIAVVTVNDPFVTAAWAKQSGGMAKMHFLADWDLAFTKALGLEMDLSAGGLGMRSKRFSMLVDDGKVTWMAIEDSPGQADKTGAAAMLEQVG